jgi:hypothetical protein
LKGEHRTFLKGRKFRGLTQSRHYKSRDTRDGAAIEPAG